MNKDRIAILGAGGFIGSRLLEKMHLTKMAEVRPIVRRFSSLARIARLAVDWRIADALDKDALCKAFEGCNIVVHSVLGDPKVILGSIDSAYYAAEKSGVRRIVYLSSASVHGQNPNPGTDERSPLSDCQPFIYNNAKVRAERRLLRLRKKGSVEIVILRPGIVYGPRSTRWTAGIADDLLGGKAYLIDGGIGVCNCIYIDNLVHAVYLAATRAGIDGEAFLIGDKEEVNWLNFYRPIADALGIDSNKIHRLSAPTFRRSWKDRLDTLRATTAVQSILPIVPKRVKKAVKAVLETAVINWGKDKTISGWDLPEEARPVVTQEIALLQQCQCRFSYKKAKETLGYEPPVKFDEGCRYSVVWLSFAGYPIKHY